MKTPDLRRWLRNLPVGAKLAVILVGVSVLVAIVVSFVLGQLALGYFQEYALYHLEKELESSLAVTPSVPEETPEMTAFLEKVGEQIKVFQGRAVPVGLFGIRPGGEVVTVAGFRNLLPDTQNLARLAGQGGTLARLNISGDLAWLVTRRVNGGLVVGVVAKADDLLKPTWSSMRNTTWLVTILLAALVALFSVWIARRELGVPLRILTEEGERVAGGNLTPPETMAERGDELGRLSRVLHSMTLTAQRMVAEARASQRRFQQLFMESRDAAFIIGHQGQIEDMNPAGLITFGFQNADQMLRLRDTVELFEDPDQRQGYLRALREQGYVQDFQATMRRTDGATFEALITASLRGEGEARFGLVRDVTATLRAQKALAESERRHRRLTENAPDIIYRWSIAAGAFEYISPAVETVTGYKPEEILHSTGIIWSVTHPEWRKAMAQHWRSVMDGVGPGVHEHEFKIVTKDGHARWLRERSILVRDEENRPAALEGIATDVTERKLVEQVAERGRRMVEATLQGLPAPVMVVDRRHRVIHWNRAMEKLTKVPAAQVVGTDQHWKPFYDKPRPVLADLIMDGDWAGMERYYGQLTMKKSAFISGGVEGESLFPNLAGRERHLYFLAAPLTDDEGQVVAAVETLVDLTDKRRLEDDLRRLTVTDELTGLYNQRFFYATLAREMETARRYGQPLCLIMADLDEFKAFNDRYGHVEGDRVLAAAAQSLRELVRATDLACRYGGEEFAVLLPRTEVEEALQVAERVRQGIANLTFSPLGSGAKPLTGQVTASVGLAQFQDGLSTHEMVRRADKAMYEAKTQGKNRVAFYRPGLGIEIFLPSEK